MMPRIAGWTVAVRCGRWMLGPGRTAFAVPTTDADADALAGYQLCAATCTIFRLDRDLTAAAVHLNDMKRPTGSGAQRPDTAEACAEASAGPVPILPAS